MEVQGNGDGSSFICAGNTEPPLPPPAEPPTASTDSAGESRRVAAEYRLRFFNFNMGNSSSFGSLSDLQGQGGRGFFETLLSEPFPDGGDVDLAFSTLVETRLIMSEWVEQYLSQKRAPLDIAMSQNACREGEHKPESKVHGWLEGIAASYNGNLKTVLAFSSRHFKVSSDAALFGRLPEAMMGNLSVPNPKKAFIGRSVTECAHDVRLCFVGAHFPVMTLAAVLDERTAESSAAAADVDPLQEAKMEVARTLRKITRRASRKGFLDDRTLIFIQGDLNSRTVLLPDGDVRDVLLDVLDDAAIQAAIHSGLSVPPGSFHELVQHDQARALPVTYKYHGQVGHGFRRPGDPPPLLPGSAVRRVVMDGNVWVNKSFTIGDVLEAAGNAKPSGVVQSEGADIYRRTLGDIDDARLRAWGIKFTDTDFRPFRFPASTDRVIYWASHRLKTRLSWSFPRGGYEVNHFQAGSDHRPVCVEAILRIAPSEGAACDGERRQGEPDPALVSSILEKLSNAEDDDSAGEGDVMAALGTVVGESAAVTGLRRHWGSLWGSGRR